MIFSGRMRAQSAGSVLTHLTSRDCVRRVRPGSPDAGAGFREGGQVFFGQV